MSPPLPRFAAIYREHFAYVWCVLRRQGVDSADLDDLTQDVFLAVHRQLHQFEGRAAVRTWLHTIAVRTARHHLRRCTARPRIASLLTPAEPASSGPSPEESTARAQARALISRLIERLDDDKRAVFVLAELEGLRAPEIAGLLDVNLRTVYSRLHAARAKFFAGLGRARARSEGPPRASDLRASKRRVWAALVLRLGEPAGPAVAAPLGTWAIVQSTAAALGLAAATLGALYVVGSDHPAQALEQSTTTERETSSRRSPEQPVRAPDAAPTIAVPDVPAAVVSEPSVKTRPRRAARARGEDGKASPPPDPLAEELILMERARAALRRGDVVGALGYYQEHGVRFPNGHLVQERDRSRAVAQRALSSRSEVGGS